MTIYSFNYLVSYTYFYILKFLFYDYNISAILYTFKIMHRAFIYFKYYFKYHRTIIFRYHDFGLISNNQNNYNKF